MSPPPPPSVPLLGPPQLHHPSVHSIAAHFNHALSIGRTENNSATFLSSGNPCLDFFFHVVPDTPAETLTSRLHQSWSHDALTTLKLVCNLRGVRGTGKSDKEGFYTAALWLHRHHPKTLAVNVSSLAEFGYFKDFPEILYRLLVSPNQRRRRAFRNRPRRGKRSKKAELKIVRRVRPAMRKPSTPSFSDYIDFFLKSDKKIRSAPKKPDPVVAETPPDPVVTESPKQIDEKVIGIREQRRIDMAKKALDRFNFDPDYRFLHERISDLFADRLKSDLESLNSGRMEEIGLSAKWCPSIDSSYDRSTLLCEAIARKVFPRDSSPEYAEIEDAHYAYRVRDRLRKEVLVPLHRALELPEVYMSANRWSKLPYSRVPSVAMKTYKELFEKHDSDRFSDYLDRAKAGKAKIAAGAVLPHEVIKSLNDRDGGIVAELQWRRMVADLAQKGKLKNCIAVCDVSGSMSGIPMEVSIALGILVSELSEEPWKGKVITFSANPQLHVIQGSNLKSKASFVEDMDWGGNTDFQKVFDRILDVAVKGRLKPEQMIKRIFVFSDMEFDQASSRPWKTDYMVIKSKYEEKGYGEAVPEIVFWNLRDSRATPVRGNQKGVALVSGFSKNLLKIFLGNDGELTPMDVMVEAISGEVYQKLVVLD